MPLKLTNTEPNLIRKRKPKSPCVKCGLHASRCICETLPSLQLATRICLVMHHRELKRTTNTGQLALHCLRNSIMRVRGNPELAPLSLAEDLVPEYRHLVYFPTENAIELNQDLVNSSPQPIQLIVPDGNWRQASKVCSRHPELAGLLRVKIGISNQAKDHLRAEHRPEGMSTLEAIARALGVIEGPEVMNSLLEVYQAKLKQTLIGRGKVGVKLKSSTVV